MSKEFNDLEKEYHNPSVSEKDSLKEQEGIMKHNEEAQKKQKLVKSYKRKKWERSMKITKEDNREFNETKEKVDFTRETIKEEIEEGEEISDDNEEIELIIKSKERTHATFQNDTSK